MLALVVASDAIVRLGVLVAKFAVKLTMFPRIQTLIVRLGVFLVELVVHIIMPLLDPVVLPAMTAVPVILVGHHRCGKPDHRHCTDCRHC